MARIPHTLSPKDWRFFIGVGVLYSASNLWTTVVYWQVLFSTHSSLWLAAAVAASTVPAVLVGLTGPEWGLPGSFAPWLGVLGALMAGGSFWFAHQPSVLVALALLEGWLSARAIPLSQTILMAATPADEAPRASARYEMASRIGVVLGPLAAGSALALSGPVAATALTGGLLLLSGLLWSRLHTPTIEREDGNEGMRSAWTVLQHDRFLVNALAIRAGGNVLWPAFTMAVPILMQQVWHAHAIGYGAFRTLWGVTTVAGTLLVVPLLGKRLKTAYFLSWALTGLAFWGIGASADLLTALVSTVVGAISSPVVHVALDSHIGSAVQPAYRSALFAIQRLVMAVVGLVGLGLMSLALHHMTAGHALQGAGVLMGLAALVSLWIWQRTTSAPTVSTGSVD
jgi:MFS family permease